MAALNVRGNIYGSMHVVRSMSEAHFLQTKKKKKKKHSYLGMLIPFDRRCVLPALCFIRAPTNITSLALVG
jgi:hypothetical protein